MQSEGSDDFDGRSEKRAEDGWREVREGREGRPDATTELSQNERGEAERAHVESGHAN